MNRTMTRREKLRIQGVIMAVVLFLIAVFTLIYALMSLLYDRIGQHPSPLLAEVISSFLSILFCMVFFTFMGRIFGKRQLSFFEPIIQALERIAQGDFSVQIEQQTQEEGPYKSLITTVNNMAVELNRMEALRQEFISNVSHEIQSPLTSIRGFAQALQNDRLSREEQIHYLEIIETESTRLSRITENLLKLATLESDQVKFEPKRYRLDKQLRSLILACEPQWSGKQIEMDADLDALEICADEDLLSQVWINLLHNSIKFTPEHGTICVELHRHNDQLEVSISDTGIGISEGDQARIFERFFKADQSRTRSDSGGSGLGLSIAHKIVEMHKGTITVHSKLGSGTTFTVRLPALAT